MEGQRCPKCRKEDWWHPPKHSIPEPALVKKTYGPTLTDRQRGVLLACQARERNRETPKSLAVAEALQVALLEIDWRRAKS